MLALKYMLLSKVCRVYFEGSTYVQHSLSLRGSCEGLLMLGPIALASQYLVPMGHIMLIAATLLHGSTSPAKCGLTVLAIMPTMGVS